MLLQFHGRLPRLCRRAAALGMLAMLGLAALPRAAAAPADTLVALGDSIASGYGLSDPRHQSYTARAAEALGMRAVNEAVAGDRTQELLEHLRTDDALRRKVAEADVITVSIGGNDILREIGPLLLQQVQGKDEILQEAAETMYCNYEAILAEIRALAPQTPVVQTNLYQPAGALGRWLIQDALDAINANYVQYLEAHPGDIVLLDIATPLSRMEGMFQDDFVHPSAAGHLEIARLLTGRLRAMGEDRTGTDWSALTAAVSQARGLLEDGVARGEQRLRAALSAAGETMRSLSAGQEAADAAAAALRAALEDAGGADTGSAPPASRPPDGTVSAPAAQDEDRGALWIWLAAAALAIVLAAAWLVYRTWRGRRPRA